MKKDNIFDDFEVIDMASEMGDVVCCDFCNLGEDTMGGVMMGSNAVCIEKIMLEIRLTLR